MRTFSPVRQRSGPGTMKVGDEGGTGVSSNGAAAGSGAIYGLGMFGAWVYYWQQADTFWEYLLAVVQGPLWPAWMVYEAFSALAA